MPHSGTGFQPVKPWKSPDLTTQRRNLPHLQASEATYFVTFRCRKGITLPEAARELTLSAIRYWDGQRIELDGAVVIPDHAHVMFRIADASTLTEILHSVKISPQTKSIAYLGGKGTCGWTKVSIISSDMKWGGKRNWSTYVASNKQWQQTPRTINGCIQRATGWKPVPPRTAGCLAVSPLGARDGHNMASTGIGVPDYEGARELETALVEIERLGRVLSRLNFFRAAFHPREATIVHANDIPNIPLCGA